jgi:uncharacterized membrane protein
MNTTLTAAKKRIDSIDQLRGIIMIIMALDHVRDFFHIGAMTADPTDPATTTPILFFTRWITHFCAPLFVFLAGTSAFLTGQKRTKKGLAVFLLKRGVWLIILEVTVFNLFFTFDPLFHAVFLQVIWVSGISMILLAALIFLPMPVLFAIGLLMVCGHNFLDRFNESPMDTDRSLLWGFLHQQYFMQYAEGRFLGLFYPLLPWPGIMILGYCLGSLYVKGYDPVKRRKLLIRVGLAAVIVFFVLRGINVYGDLRPWEKQETTTRTIISFFNLTKYPPSLLYICMTIGPGLLMLAWLEKIKAGWTNIVVVYGRVPMFYYMLHFLFLHILCTIVFFASGRTMDQAAGMMLFRPNDFGFSLGIIYLIWIAVVAFFYPLCKKYSQYKASHDHWWLSYM